MHVQIGLQSAAEDLFEIRGGEHQERRARRIEFGEALRQQEGRQLREQPLRRALVRGTREIQRGNREVGELIRKLNITAQ
mgnify:CR=1 FL=1